MLGVGQSQYTWLSWGACTWELSYTRANQDKLLTLVHGVVTETEGTEGVRPSTEQRAVLDPFLLRLPLPSSLLPTAFPFFSLSPLLSLIFFSTAD